MRSATMFFFAFVISATSIRAEIPDTAKQDPRFKLGYLVVTAYPGVKNDGTGDSTKGIQQAIVDAFDNDLTVLFPQGEYLISDSLKCYKYQLWSQEKAETDGATAKGGSLNPTGGRHMLLGEAAGDKRPLIRLAKSATGFDDAEKPRPLLAFRNFRATGSGGTEPAEPENPIGLPENFEDATPNLFNEMLCNIDFDCGGNSGAIGVHAAAAQDSSVMNVRVNAEGAYAGFNGLPGRNSITANIEVIGGRIGLRLIGSLAGAVVVGVRLVNQTENAVSHTDFCPLAMVGFEIIKQNGPAIVIQPNDHTSNCTMSLLDGRIELADGGTAIDNAVGKTLYLRNVYVTGAETLIQSGTEKPVAAAEKNSRIKEYSYADQTPVPEDDPPYEKQDFIFPVYNVIDGNVSHTPEAIVSVEPVESAPEDIVSRHVWERLPIYTGQSDTTVVNAVTDCGATPDDDIDDTEAIQKAIDMASEAGHGWAFLPGGDYHIGRTLELKANTILTGAGSGNSRILTSPDWTPTEGETAVMVTTVDDADAHPALAFLTAMYPSEEFKIDQPTLKSGNVDSLIPARHHFTALKWRAGRDSMTAAIELTHSWLPIHLSLYPAPIIHYTGNAGGRHYMVQPRAQSAHRDNRGVLVDGTHEPLALYGLNSEKPYTPKPKENTGMSDKEWGAIYALKTNVEVKNAKNVRIYGMKREGLSPSLIVRDSENVALFSSGAMRGPTQEGFGGYVQFEGKCKNVMATVLMTQTVSENRGEIDENREPMLREALEGQDEIVVKWPESVAVYKRGELDDSMFSRTKTSASGPVE